MLQIQYTTQFNNLEKLGVCLLNVVPVRALPGDRNELVTQLLFGETYEIIEISENGEWYKINSFIDQYQGWIDFKQHSPISAQELSLFNLGNVLTQRLKTKNSELLEGSIIPNYPFRDFTFEPIQNQSLTHSLQSDNNLVTLIKYIAYSYINTPYLWGGKTAFGIDCSGFVQVVFRQIGILLPRDAYQQEEVGKKIDFSERKAGDLVFFVSKTGKISHVGILTSENAVIHAHGKVREDLIDEKGIYNKERACYSHELYSIKRVQT